jgi:CheY-like chemotaxis protein
VSPSRRRILVVDDEPTIRDMLHAALELRTDRYDVIEAGNAVEAVSMARTEAPDLVLLDVLMPDHDGFWVCETLKHDPTTAHIPVVMLTSMTLDSDRQRATEAGADAYVVKPFSPRALLAFLDERFPS